MTDADKAQMIKEVVSELHDQHYILPKWAIHLWATALFLVCAGDGITSWINFREAVGGDPGCRCLGRPLIVVFPIFL
ncbi:MAG: hypothetical protein IT436_14050 [Phycisphaerales bacterium]|nr:hypothetical protein [Phycisphaerales bacterium]